MVEARFTHVTFGGGVVKSAWVLLGIALLTMSCTGSASGPLGVANCEPADGRVLSGDLDGDRWMVSVEESGGFTLLAVEINGLDQGAVVVSDSSWYHAEIGSIVILTGGLPSRTTQAVAVMADGTHLAFCPFGDGDLLVAAGAVDADQIVDLEFRQGGAVIAAAHVQELRRLSDAELFAFNVTPPGAVDDGGTGLVRSPGAELTFDDDDTG